jgi:hypothetical protein
MPNGHYHPPLCLNGQINDVSHPDSFRFEASSAKAPRQLRINVRFTNHCYTEAFDPARHPTDGPWIMDGQRRRAFCPDRHALSNRLPGLIRLLANPGVRVHETASRRNWMHSVAVELPIDGSRYQIFFALRRTVPDRRRRQDLDMVVESAYPADPSRPEPNIVGRVSFLPLAGSPYVGKPVTNRR